MAPKKASATGTAALQPLDHNQETVSLREARSQKRKAVSPTPPEDEIDQEIRDMEMLHQQVQRKKEKMARLAELQKQIDEASEEVRHLTQDEQHRRPQHQDLHQEGFLNEDDWNHHFVAKAEGLVVNQLPRVPDKAGHGSSSIPVHPGSRRVPSGVRPEVLAFKGTGTNSAQRNCH